MSESFSEYRALVEKVSASTAGIEARRRTDLACRRGCDQCCQVELEVLPVEAEVIRAHLAAMDDAEREAIRESAEQGSAACVMLGPDGGCRIYEARPIVCRTQGHALSYPAGIVPVDAVHGRVGDREITFCPLNYRDAPPEGVDVLDAPLLERLVFVVGRRFAAEKGLDPEKRMPLRALAGTLPPDKPP